MTRNFFTRTYDCHHDRFYLDQSHDFNCGPRFLQIYFCFKNICRNGLPQTNNIQFNYFRASNIYLLNIFFAVYQGSGPNSLNGYQIKLLLKSSLSRCIRCFFFFFFTLYIYYLVRLFLTFIYQASRWKGVVAKSSVVPQRPGKVMGYTRLDYQA